MTAWKPIPESQVDLPFNKQVGGNHYKHLRYQPVGFLMDIQANTALGYAIKYLSRDKNPDDLDKAIHCVELYAQWYFSKVTEGINYSEPNATVYGMFFPEILDYTHQFNPNVAIAMQQILKCQDSFFIYEETPEGIIAKVNEFKFNATIQSAINAIKGLKQ